MSGTALTLAAGTKTGRRLMIAVAVIVVLVPLAVVVNIAVLALAWFLLL